MIDQQFNVNFENLIGFWAGFGKNQTLSVKQWKSNFWSFSLILCRYLAMNKRSDPLRAFFKAP